MKPAVVGLCAALAAVVAVRYPIAETRTDATAFPLHVLPGKRYLADSSGKPFLLVGDSPSSLVVRPTREEVLWYLDDRVSRGFNTILFELIEHYFADNPPLNAYGAAPFKGRLANRNGSTCINTSSSWSKILERINPPFAVEDCWDFSDPNEAYWENVDFVIKEATDRGFLVLVEPAFLGYEGRYKGWYEDMVANGPAVLRKYGEFLAKRYKNYRNIIWVEGGDFIPPPSGTQLVEAIAEGIRSVSPDALQTAHTVRDSSAFDYWSREPWLTVNAIYSDELPYVQARAQDTSERLPFFLIESWYEGESADAMRVRSQAYQAMLTGAFGQIYGSGVLYPFLPGWRQALDSPGAESMTHLETLLTNRTWWELAPDDGALVADGQGAAASFSPAAVAEDKSFAIVYFSGTRKLGINLSAVAGPRVNAYWYDPSNGHSSPVSGSPFAERTKKEFNPPGRNAHGDADWLLLIESAR